jgi:hypothetical protein
MHKFPAEPFFLKLWGKGCRKAYCEFPVTFYSNIFKVYYFNQDLFRQKLYLYAIDYKIDYFFIPDL